MAQLNITLNQEEILELLQDSRPDAFKNLLQGCLNGVLQVESSEQLKAEPYERTGARTDSRNRNRERPRVTRLGKIELKVPRHRNVPFNTLVFDNYKRSEAALVTTMAEMVVGGVSTAKVSRVMEEIGGTSFSKQAVSDACKVLDSAVEDFRIRPLDEETVMLLPKDMRRCTRTSNYLERLNKEVKRRSRVIGIFPNTSSAIRLLGALLMEENDRWATMRKIYYKAAIQELKERTHLLIDLARQQCLLAKVA